MGIIYNKNKYNHKKYLDNCVREASIRMCASSSEEGSDLIWMVYYLTQHLCPVKIYQPISTVMIVFKWNDKVISFCWLNLCANEFV